MSESNSLDINSLHGMVQREIEDDSLLEIAPDFYRVLSDFLGSLKRQEYDGVEGKIKDTMMQTATDLATMLIQTRLDKITRHSSANMQSDRLLDEEKFIVASGAEQKERMEMILLATINGKSKLLESITKSHKTTMIAVRFLKNVDQLVGADLAMYGPFNAEDIATIPYENAQALITKRVAVKIRWDD